MKKKKMEPKLWELNNWDLNTIQTFSSLITCYNQIPSTKKLISSMIKFNNMYTDIAPSPFHFDLFSAVDDKNEHRRAVRTRIYLNKKDLIKTVDGKNGKRLILTSRGHKIFYDEYPLAKLRKEKWNGEWTLVNYDFPNQRKVDRDSFRRKLIEYGFGCPQESLYVSPLPLSKPLRHLIEGEKYGEFAWVATARRILGLTNSEICEKSWNLKRLNELYGKLLSVLWKVRKINNRQLTNDWKLHFLALNETDPYLPKELMPEGWLGTSCEKEFSQLGLPSLLQTIFHKS